MPIDLARNALSIAAPASVRVQNAMRVVRYESVMHIASKLCGEQAARDRRVFSAGALAVARSPHVVQLPRLRSRRTLKS